MNNLPPELQQFAAILDARPGPIQAALQYPLLVDGRDRMKQHKLKD